MAGREGDMKAFVTELKGKTVMTKDGQILGILDNFMMNTRSGKLETMLIAPAENLETRLFKGDQEGHVVLPIKTMRAVKDVVVVEYEHE
jgi:sporulation protein YlmC with PRC-barrel domain